MKTLFSIFAATVILNTTAFAQDLRTWTINTGSNNYPNYISYYNGAFYLFAGDGNISRIDPNQQVGTNNPFTSTTGLPGLTTYQAVHTWGYSINSRGQNVLLALTSNGTDSISVITLDATGHRIAAWAGPTISVSGLPSGSISTTHDYNLIATDNFDRVYIAVASGVQVFDTIGNTLKTLSVNGIAASVAIDPDDQTLWVISYPSGTDPDVLSHYAAYPDDTLLNTWNLNSPLPGIPDSHDPYSSWGEVAAASSRIEITQGFSGDDVYHRALQFFSDSVRLNCSFTTGRIKAHGLCLHGDTMMYLEVDASTGIQYLNFVTGGAFCDQVTPPTPSGLIVSNGTSCVNLQWNASSGASDYNIYRRAPGGTYSRVGETATAGTSASPFQDCAVRPNTEYCYVVSSVNSSGFESAYSNERCNTTNPPSPSDYNFSITTDKTNGIYSKGDQVNFTFHVTRKADNSAVAGAGVIVYDPSIGFASCPNVTTGKNGMTQFTSIANGLSGWVAYGFEFATPPTEAITDSEQYWIFIDDGSTLTPGAQTFSVSMPPGYVNAPGQTVKPVTANEVLAAEYDGLKAGVMAAVQWGLTCGGGIIVGGASEVASAYLEVPSPFDDEAIAGLCETGAVAGLIGGAAAIGGAVSATHHLLDNIPLTPAKNSQLNSCVDLYLVAQDGIFVAADLLEALEGSGGEPLYTAVIGQRKPGIRDFSSIPNTANDFATLAMDIGSASYTCLNGMGDVLNIPGSNNQLFIASAILADPAAGGILSPLLTIAFTFDPQRPQIPLPIVPSNDTTQVAPNAAMRWDTAARAVTYQLQVSTDSSSFPASRAYRGKVEIQSVPLLINDSTLTSTDTVLNLQPNQVYYWRVRAIGDTGLIGNWSPIYQFTTGSLSSVQIKSPMQASQFKCYPNPVSGAETLSYSLADESQVRFTIYDALGRIVARPVVGEMESVG